jgi:formylglycine-generating enzyme required for sulfatase activity
MIEIGGLCPGCFVEKEPAPVCGQCGYDESAPRPSIFLPHRTVLRGSYAVGRALGPPGGFGLTCLALDLRLAITVALKEFFPRGVVERSPHSRAVSPLSEADGVAFERGLRLFVEEARTLAAFDHPNVVRVRDFFEENGTAYLVMDHVRGVSLDAEVRRRGPLSEERALAVVLPILDALAAVHARGVLHRDVAPQNIHIRDDGRPVLLDFGSARQAVRERSCGLTVVYTPGFAPYEQYIRAGRQGPWTDVYGAAATLYFASTGSSPPGAIEREIHDELVPARRTAPGLSRRLEAALAAGLRLDPAERPQTADAFRSLLAPRRFDREVSPRTGRRARHAARTAAVALVVLAAGFYLGAQLSHRWPTASARSAPPPAPPPTTAPAGPSPSGEAAVTWVDPASGLELAWIPPGTFRMGSAAFPSEGPIREVRIRTGFWLQTTEVTRRQWMAVVGTSPWALSVSAAAPAAPGDCDDCPATFVTWSDAHLFAERVNERAGGRYRLPSEAEWEYASRAGSTLPYHFGETAEGLARHAWYEENAGNLVGQDRPHPVRGRLPNRWGLFDMYGNVYEWCEDWYHTGYRGAPTDGGAWRRPVGTAYVARGGSYSSSALSCRSASRKGFTPESYGNLVGFRLVRSP